MEPVQDLLRGAAHVRDLELRHHLPRAGKEVEEIRRAKIMTTV